MGLLLRPKKAIRHYLMRTSLKNILLWLFIPVFVLCILVNLVITNILVRRQVRENALVSISEVVSQTKYHLDYRLYSTFEQMVLFEQSPDVAALITQYDEEETGKLERIVTVFNNLSRIYNSSYSVLDSVFVAIQQGDKPIDIFYRSDYPPSRSDFSFSLVMNGEPLIEQGGRSYQWFNLHENNINPNTYTDNRVASLYKVFGDRESKSRALFLFNFKNSFFRQLFGEISVTDNGYFALLGDGTVMSFQDSSNPYRISPEVLNTIEANQNTPGNMVFQAANGKRYFAVWESLQLGHWKLAAIVPESDLVRPVNSVTLITVVCSLFAIGAALILSLLVIRLISVPIKNWTGKIEKISSTGTENPDILLDDAVCTEMLEFNRGITELMSRVKQLGKEKLLEEEQKRKLAIRVMSEQIKPHFLYNALHLIEQLGNMGEYKKMTEIVTALSGFYRLSLSRGRELIELKDEIAHAQNYLYIQMIQNKRLFCKIEADEEFSGVKVVKLSLQPILENAVIHGMKHAEDLHLNIKIEGADNSVKIIISDDGMGIPGNKLDALCRAFETNDWSALPEVFGIRNVHERLRLHYGSPYGVSIESAFEEGTKVTILIPGSQS